MSSWLVSTVICPKCHAEQPVSLHRCNRCGASLSSHPSQPAAGWSPSARRSESQETRIIDRPWLIVIVLLHVGLLGIPLYWKTNYSTQTRIWICIASIAYTVFAVAVIIWGLMQIAKLFSG